MSFKRGKFKDKTKIEESLEPMYDALLLLPSLYNYDDKDLKILSDIFLALGNNEAFINFIILFSGETIKIPEVDKIELCVKMVNAYNYYIKNYKEKFEDIKTIRLVLKKFKIETTRENINFFRRIDSFLNKK